MLVALPFLFAASAPHIDLYTMGQGEHLFERFGHAAVCVVDDRHPSTSRCYNYGTTDFGSPPQKLGWGFLRGNARFWVSVWPLDKMLATYVEADRTIWRQRLRLSPTEMAAFERRLASDAQEANRYYVYHHFHDNCSTRIRDILDDVTGGRLARGAERSLGTTYRQLGVEGLADQPLIRATSDFVVGRAADQKLSAYEAMFLPERLRAEVARQFHAEPTIVYERRGHPFPRTGSTGRYYTALLAALVLLPVVVGEWWKRARTLLLALTGAALGLMALALWGLALVSTVPEIRWNEALLLFWPTDLLLPWLAGRGRTGYSRLRLSSVLVVSGLAALGLLAQPLFAPALIPLAVFSVLSWPLFGSRAQSVWPAHASSPGGLR